MSGYSHTIKALLSDIKEKYEVSYFVETGTFQGDTTKIAQDIFERVFTIELNDKAFQKNKGIFSENVTCLLGDSRNKLKELLPVLDKNAVFFLDAHWAGGLTARAEVDSPLIEELRIIRSRDKKFQDIIIIDDFGWVGKKEKIEFKPEWKSKYFPEGGVFEYDWSYISSSQIRTMFLDKVIVEKDDRMIIYT